MSQSLFYDAISSTYEDGVDDLSCFTPDNIQSLTPDFATSSQQTVDSIDSDPSSDRSISLPRVGPGRSKAYVLYDSMVHTEWICCTAGIWEHYYLVASVTDGSPKLMCQRCSQILEHPYMLRAQGSGRHGTSTMIRHYKAPMTKNPEFSQENWERELFNFITVAHLPFRLIEHPEFCYEIF
ncbi:uncharacterized protein N7473_013256 [Penicillium subrubescens]|uniref:uncharacterized protein n=1 Tax=Penicillium subrubescens TaxID=1316194 RepID=UPI00254526F3|nr:uncharacterized protein N7473_013256 [Penicillium subrubescens]KAJ5873383.1 hypothetical protein N7473_013256 [Penicillium subrubescens]